MKNPFRSPGKESALPSEQQPYGLSAPQEDDGVDLMGYWRTIRKRAKSIALLTAAVTVVGIAVAFSLQNIYRSTATLAIEPPSRGQGGGNRVEEAAPGNPFAESLQTQIEILNSRRVAFLAVQELKLWEDPVFNAQNTDSGWLGQLRRMLGGDPQVKQGELTNEAKAEALVGRFSGGLSTRIVPRTQIIEVSYDSPNPAFAAKAANALVKAFILEDQQSRSESASGLNTELLDRAKDLQKNLRESEIALQKFREKNSLVALKGSSQGVSARQMEELMPKVVSARVKVTELETALKQVQSVKDGDYTTVPWVMNYGPVPAAREREVAARFKVAELSQNYGFEHPRMVQAQAELKEAGENLRRQVGVAVASLTREYENARNTEQALDRAMRGERSQVRDVNRIEFQLGQLEREVESNRQLYDAFITRAKQLDVASNLERTIVRPVNMARPTTVPYSPKKGELITIFFAIGLLGSIGLALLLDRLDNTVKGPTEAEARTNLPVITTVPLLKEDELAVQVLTHFKTDPSGVFSEAFRTARTGLLLSALDDVSRVFMVTSSSPGEGKTTVAMNLALAMAQTKRTLLIEADMRRPRIAQDLELSAGIRGLANLVAGNAGLEECLHPISETDLVFMPSGDIPPNPLDLLFSKRFEETIQFLKTKFEFIVIDTPPVELVSDGVAISRVASAVIYVVRAGTTPYPVMLHGLEKLRRADAPLLGLVLNQMDFDKAHKYYGEYSGYSTSKYGDYSYGYGQGASGATDAEGRAYGASRSAASVSNKT
jgi:polysaccharide biosynthesis transport protein